MLRGAAVIVLLMLNLCLWGVLVLAVALLKLIFVRTRLRRPILKLMARLAEGWVGSNNRIFDLLLPTAWDIRGVDGIQYDGHYLIVANHISWVDIFVLFRAFHGEAAFIRFFLKHELFWVPIIGQACWALDFPFMKRYSPEYLEKHPEKKGEDLRTTRRSCRRYRGIPVAILNFLEGTRFSLEKQADQGSPYRFLLRPRIGGISFVFASLGEQLDSFFDVTLAYPGHEVRFLQFISGKVERVTVIARRVDVPPEFCSPEVTEAGPVRERFKGWIEELWREKDALLAKLLAP